MCISPAICTALLLLPPKTQHCSEFTEGVTTHRQYNVISQLTEYHKIPVNYALGLNNFVRVFGWAFHLPTSRASKAHLGARKIYTMYII